MYFSEVLPLNLKREMKRAGFSIKNMSRSMDVSETAVQAWRSGKALPATRKLPVIANLLNCSLDSLFTDGGQSFKLKNQKEVNV